MTRFRSARLLLGAILIAALATGAVLTAQRTSNAMATAATRFLDSLSPEQRKQATFAVESEELLRWNFIPDETFPRNGLPLKAMSDAQRKLAHELLKSGLSERGYLTYTAIIQLENILRAIEGGVQMARDPVAYRFSIFGQPSASGNWAWRVEGHHVSLHFAIANGRVVSSTPSFAGSNPAEVRDGPQKGQRTLAVLEDTARALVMALDQTQRGTAIINATAPNDIVTNNRIEVDPLSPAGLTASAMTAAQRDLLIKVIDAYAGLMASELASDRMAKIKAAGIEKIGFAWAGAVERGQRHYYRVQGPTFLIEYDNTQGNGNHIHSVWRDFRGDFGRDVLREHIKTAHVGTQDSGL
jgi:hypothetical protein